MGHVAGIVAATRVRADTRALSADGRCVDS